MKLGKCEKCGMEAVDTPYTTRSHGIKWENCTCDDLRNVTSYVLDEMLVIRMDKVCLLIFFISFFCRSYINTVYERQKK